MKRRVLKKRRWKAWRRSWKLRKHVRDNAARWTGHVTMLRLYANYPTLDFGRSLARLEAILDGARCYPNMDPRVNASFSIRWLPSPLVVALRRALCSFHKHQERKRQ